MTAPPSRPRRGDAGSSVDVTQLWRSGTRAHLAHAARSPLVQAHGRVELTLDVLEGGPGRRRSATFDRAAAEDDLRPVTAQLEEAMAVVDALLLAVPGGSHGRAVTADGGTGDAPDPEAGLRDQVAEQVVAFAGRGDDHGTASAPWAVVDHRGRLGCLSWSLPAGWEAHRGDLVLVVGWLLARWAVDRCEVVLGGRRVALEVGGGPGRPSVSEPRTVPLGDDELARRRIARSLREVPSSTAVDVALAFERLASAGATLTVADVGSG